MPVPSGCVQQSQAAFALETTERLVEDDKSRSRMGEGTCQSDALGFASGESSPGFAKVFVTDA